MLADIPLKSSIVGRLTGSAILAAKKVAEIIRITGILCTAGKMCFIKETRNREKICITKKVCSAERSVLPNSGILKKK